MRLSQPVAASAPNHTKKRAFLQHLTRPNNILHGHRCVGNVKRQTSSSRTYIATSLNIHRCFTFTTYLFTPSQALPANLSSKTLTPSRPKEHPPNRHNVSKSPRPTTHHMHHPARPSPLFLPSGLPLYTAHLPLLTSVIHHTRTRVNFPPSKHADHTPIRHACEVVCRLNVEPS
jgi:hypothetical protein